MLDLKSIWWFTFNCRSQILPSQASFPSQSKHLTWVSPVRWNQCETWGEHHLQGLREPPCWCSAGEAAWLGASMLLTSLVLKRGCRRCLWRLSLIYPFSPSKDIVIFPIDFLQCKLEQQIQDIEVELLVMRTELSIMHNSLDDLQNERKSEWSRKPEEWSFKQPIFRLTDFSPFFFLFN